MDIYFLRHANAGEAKLNSTADEKRPIDELGTRQSHDMGSALRDMKVGVDVIISSPLLRAVQTAEIAAAELGYAEEVVLDDALRPEATYDDFQQLLQRYAKNDSIMVVGHNPSLTMFLNKFLAAGSAFNAIELKKGAVAKVEKDGRNPALLKWCITPKLVRAIQQARPATRGRKPS
jgi:phosphohistidine phosphatase